MLRKPWNVNWARRGDMAGGLALSINLLLKSLIFMVAAVVYLVVGVYVAVRWLVRRCQADGLALQARSRQRPSSLSWKLVHSGWTIPALILMGMGTWFSFLYIGLRAKNSRWLAWAALYFVLGAFLLTVATLVANHDGMYDGAEIARTVAVVTSWLGGGAHALAVNRTWLRWRAWSDDGSCPVPVPRELVAEVARARDTTGDSTSEVAPRPLSAMPSAAP